jgi:acetyl esterase/lipase
MIRFINLPGFLVTFVLKTAEFLAAFIAPLLVSRKRVERRKGIAYGEGECQVLDIYLPRGRAADVALPISLFIHGGGFRYFSKESHAAAAARLAESGRIVFCIDYRLTPKHPFPEGLTDAAIAYDWMVRHATEYGGDLTRISMIGESSGAGFIVSLCLYLFGFAKFPTEVSLPPIPTALPKAAIIHCGYYEVSDVERFAGDPRVHRIAHTRVEQIRANYLPGFATARRDFVLADPAVVLAEHAAHGGKLPADFPEIFIPVGEKDPVIGDSERLARTLAKLGQPGRLKVYPGVGHAFYAAPWGTQAKACWADIDAFLDRAKT